MFIFLKRFSAIFKTLLLNITMAIFIKVKNRNYL